MPEEQGKGLIRHQRDESNHTGCGWQPAGSQGGLCQYSTSIRPVSRTFCTFGMFLCHTTAFNGPATHVTHIM